MSEPMRPAGGDWQAAGRTEEEEEAGETVLMGGNPGGIIKAGKVQVSLLFSNGGL